MERIKINWLLRPGSLSYLGKAAAGRHKLPASWAYVERHSTIGLRKGNCLHCVKMESGSRSGLLRKFVLISGRQTRLMRKAKSIKIVSPFLHHFYAFFPVLGPVVCCPDGILADMRQLDFDNIKIIALLIQQGRRHASETVRGHFRFGESHGAQCRRNPVFRQGFARSWGRE